MSPTFTCIMDLRGLEPPEPLSRVLEALAVSSPGLVIEARLERRPMFLIEELHRRNQDYTCTQQPDSSWTLRLCVSEPGFVVHAQS